MQKHPKNKARIIKNTANIFNTYTTNRQYPNPQIQAHEMKRPTHKKYFNPST